jgi:hypothetical protein
MARIAEITRRLQSCAQGEPAAVAAPQVRHTDSELAAMSNAFVAQRVTVQQPQPKPRQDPPTPFDAHQQRVALAAASERQISTNAAIARAQLREIERWKESPDNPANAETVPVMQARIKQLEAQVADYKTRCLPVGLDARSMSQIIARAEALLAAQKK